MKKILFALFILSSATLFAQERHDNNKESDNVPSPVRQSFQKDNPQANNTMWGQDQKNNQWHANYKDDHNRNTDAYYDPNGSRVETHITLNQSEVPVTVNARINTKYNPEGNYHAERIERPDYQPLYKIKYHRKNKDRVIYMDGQGKKRHFHDYHDQN